NPWRQAVTVNAGQRTTVTAALTPPAPTVGSLRVLSSAPEAQVFVDGEPKGVANQEIKDVRPGTHIIEVRAAGFDSKRIEVEIKPNDLRVVQMDLTATVVQKQLGGLRVISPVPNAEVFLDG